MSEKIWTVPNIVFKTRVKDEEGNFGWKDVTSLEYFGDKRVLLFSLPGAYTPTCSTYQLPGFEKLAPEFKKIGVDDIYCMSVNDSFVMNAWAKNQNLQNVKVIPDGGGQFTRQMGMLVRKDPQGFGYRSWRYAVLINDGVVEKIWEEPGKEDDCATDPYENTKPEDILKELTEE
tara:strand:+ start:655 stop:1176 length:522 start_codon:yes stop_codon:yes gene_type:complete